MKKLTYEFVKDQIENVLHKGSKLISTEYVNSRTKLRIQCENGHIFDTPWCNINGGSWCIKCSGKEKHTVEFIKDQIENILPKGSKLISTEYVNAYTKLDTKCENGHLFKMHWGNISNNHWCGQCYKMKRKNLLI